MKLLGVIVTAVAIFVPPLMLFAWLRGRLKPNEKPTPVNSKIGVAPWLRGRRRE